MKEREVLDRRLGWEHVREHDAAGAIPPCHTQLLYDCELPVPVFRIILGVPDGLLMLLVVVRLCHCIEERVEFGVVENAALINIKVGTELREMATKLV